MNIIYDHCWQINKPKEDQIALTPFPPDFFTKGFDAKNPFYKMRTESVCCPKQYDGYDCGVGLTFAIMRFVRAFNIVNVSEKWIDSIGVVIPSSIFSSLKYSIIHKNHLEALRIESFHPLDLLSLILHDKYEEPETDTIYKTQFASISLPSYQKLDDIFMNHDDVDYLTP